MRSKSRDGRADGQVIVVFAVALVAILAAVGLVLDGGSTFAQRRSQQSSADLAAIAGANDYLLNHDVTLATARARAIAGANGFTDGAGNVSVTVNVDTSNGAQVDVGITAPHPEQLRGSPWNGNEHVASHDDGVGVDRLPGLRGGCRADVV